MPGSVTGREKETHRGRQMISGPSGETNDGRKTVVEVVAYNVNELMTGVRRTFSPKQ